MLNNANKALGYTEVYYNYKTGKLFTDDIGNQFQELNISTEGNGGNGGGLVAGDNVSALTNDADYVSTGANISVFNNDAGYLTSVAFPVVNNLPATANFGDICALTTDSFPYFYDGTAWRKMNLYAVPNPDPQPDSDWDQVTLRVTFNDENCNNEVNNNGPTARSASVVGSPAKFGGGSLRVQTNQLISYDQPDILDSAYTIEFWMYLDSYGPDTERISILHKAGWYFYQQFVSTQNLRFGWFNPGTNQEYTITTSQSLPLQMWHHIALCRKEENGILTMFVNGVKAGEVFGNDITDNAAEDFIIQDALTSAADMYIDDLRISTFERYTDAFTPPQAELPITGE